MRAREVALDGCDVVLVRGIPRGSLEQVVFRVDVLHALAAAGVRAVNSAHAIERTVDKFLASTLLARAGLPTPRTIACERPADALEAFAELGGDVIVKPLFGSMGFGMVRVDDHDVAQRVFRALELERAVYYLQETLPHAGRDVRALVVGERVVAAIERSRRRLAHEPRARRARAAGAARRRTGAPVRARRRPPSAPTTPASTSLRAPDGRDYVLEVNGIPGWQGVERATGVDVAAALAEHLETCGEVRGAERAQLLGSDRAAVQGGGDERAGRPGFGQGAQVGDVAHAAAGQQLELGKAGAELAHQRDVGARAGSDAREVEHDHLAHAGVAPAAPAPRPRRAGPAPGRARGRAPRGGRG